MRTGVAVVVALLVAAVPSVVSLCELRCVASEIASETAPPACAGHGTNDETSPSVPSGGQHDCTGHVLLAKGGATRIALQLDPAVAAALPPAGSVVPTAEEWLQGGKLESADLSPPFGRSSDILRL
jgi:hypothetical protein